MSDDGALFRRLREMWMAVDPMPPGLVDRVLFTLQLEDLEYELLRLHYTEEPAGARSEQTVRTVTFTSEYLTVTLMLAAATEPTARLDGWLSPAAALRVGLRTAEGTQETIASPEGRFAFPSMPSGPFRVLIYPPDDAASQFSRPVITPAVQL